jgi:hypothetical protein
MTIGPSMIIHGLLAQREGDAIVIYLGEDIVHTAYNWKQALEWFDANFPPAGALPAVPYDANDKE